MTDYTLQIIDQNTGNRNIWKLNEVGLATKLLEILLDNQKQNEVILIEKR